MLVLPTATLYFAQKKTATFYFLVQIAFKHQDKEHTTSIHKRKDYMDFMKLLSCLHSAINNFSHWMYKTFHVHEYLFCATFFRFFHLKFCSRRTINCSSVLHVCFLLLILIPSIQSLFLIKYDCIAHFVLISYPQRLKVYKL